MTENPQQVFFSPQISPLLARVDSSRRAQYLQAFEGLDGKTFVVNTGKDQKRVAQQQLIEFYLGVTLNQVLSYEDDQEEAQFPMALQVAEWKALQPRRNRQGIKGEVAGELVTSGSDVNAWRRIDGRFVAEHKFERTRTQFENPYYLEAVQKQLMSEYCDLPEIKIKWDLGTHIINGKDHQFGDQIEIISAPVDRELMRAHLEVAVSSGLFYTSNLHFAALECLIENGKVKSVAFLPKELQDQGIGFKQMRQTPTHDLLQQALHSVITNAPISYAI